MKRAGDPLLIESLIKGRAPRRALFKFSLILIAVAGCILALANPRVEGPGEPDIRRGIDLVLAVDVSKSMLAPDLAPNRLANAKALLQILLRDRPDDRVALVLFAGHAYTQLPLTYDHGSAAMFVQSMDPLQFSAQGTAVGGALSTAHDILKPGRGRYKVVLLLSDGETFDGDNEKENVGATSAQLADAGIMVITVGLGSPGGTTFIDPLTKTQKKDRQGVVVVSRLDDALLKGIATKTKGDYYLFTSPAETERAVLRSLDGAKNAALVDKSLLNYRTLYLWLAVPVLLLLVAEPFVPDHKNPKA
jgi:Ca-activated chloride channel family protein